MFLISGPEAELPTLPEPPAEVVLGPGYRCAIVCREEFREYLVFRGDMPIVPARDDRVEILGDEREFLVMYIAHVINPDGAIWHRIVVEEI